MANYYELTKSVRITNNSPIDGDRYIAADITARDALISTNRAHNGLQVYVLDSDGSGNPQLYILTDINAPTWDTISLKDGVKNFIELEDTPADWSTAQDGSIVTVDTSGSPTKLKFTDALTAFNRDFGNTVDMDGGDIATPSDNKANTSGFVDKVARIDHNHDGKYYTKDVVDNKLAAVNAGIKYIWDNKDEIDIEAPSPVDGEQGLLKDSTVGTTTSIVCDSGDWEDQTVYQYNETSSCWKALYTLGGANMPFADEVDLHSGPYNDKSIIVSEGIGQYIAGEFIGSDVDVYTILKKILEKVLPATIKTPASITPSFTGVTGNVEVGTDLSGVVSASINQGIISSYNPADLPNKMDVPQVGAISTQSLSNATGGYIISAMTVSGAANFGANTFVSSFGSATETTAVYNSNGDVDTSIARSISKNTTFTATGQTYMSYGTEFSTDDTAPAFVNDRAGMLAEPNKQLMGATAFLPNKVLTQNANSAGRTWIYVTLKGTYTAAQARAKISVYDKDTNDQLFSSDSLQVQTFTMNDAGTGTLDYTTAFLNGGVWTADKNVNITIS